MINAYILCEELGMTIDNPHIGNFEILPVSGDELVIQTKDKAVKVRVDKRGFNLSVTQLGTVGAYYKVNIHALSCTALPTV